MAIAEEKAPPPSYWSAPADTANVSLPAELRGNLFLLDRSVAPEETAARLKESNHRARAAGWRGVGLSLDLPETKTRGKPPTSASKQTRTLWRERLERSREAGVGFWKISAGETSATLEEQRLIAELAREIYPALWVEFTPARETLNDWKNSGRWRGGDVQRADAMARWARALGAGPVTPELAVPTTLDRVVQMLRPHAKGQQARLINSGDVAYLGAALGCALGVERVPASRVTDVVRALRWQQVAPPWPADGDTLAISPQANVDAWFFRKGESDFSLNEGRAISQGAPATVARGLALPLVKSEGEAAPYVLASRHPNGAISVAVLPRVGTDRVRRTSAADVTLIVSEVPTRLAVFGPAKSLTITCAIPPAGGRWRARDLAAPTEAPWIEMADTRVPTEVAMWRFDGAELQRLGTAAQAAGDDSAPGVWLEFTP